MFRYSNYPVLEYELRCSFRVSGVARVANVAATKKCARPILRRSNANTDWAYLCTIDSQCWLNSWAACAMLIIGCLSGAGIAHRLPETAVVIKTLILLHML